MKVRPLRQLSVLGLLLSIPAVALAQPSGAATDGVESTETLLSLIQKGGWLMYPIALCSIVVLMYAIERLISLRRARTTPLDLVDDVFDQLPAAPATKAQREETAEMLRDSQSLLGATLASGVLEFAQGRATVERAIAEAGSRQLHLLRRRLRPFAVVETLAPLLGLLGTVYGMITCFENATTTDAASRADTLAQGIYQALVTTAAGLTVAIPAKVLFHWFEGRVDRILDRIEEESQRFIDHYFDEDDAPAAPSPRATRAEPRRGQEKRIPSEAPVERDSTAAALADESGDTDEPEEDAIPSDGKRHANQRGKRLIAKAMKKKSGSA